MKKKRARRMLETAREYVGDDVFTSHDFAEVKLKRFLRTYLWVIYVSGFRNAVVKRHFRGLKGAFYKLDLDAIAAIDSIDASVLPIRNQKKADAFVRGCRMIQAEEPLAE